MYECWTSVLFFLYVVMVNFTLYPKKESLFIKFGKIVILSFCVGDGSLLMSMDCDHDALLFKSCNSCLGVLCSDQNVCWFESCCKQTMSG